MKIVRNMLVNEDEDVTVQVGDDVLFSPYTS